jgi:hypothetical protein
LCLNAIMQVAVEFEFVFVNFNQITNVRWIYLSTRVYVLDDHI